jgi:NADH-quinone oxidoreductase subunit J
MERLVIIVFAAMTLAGGLAAATIRRALNAIFALGVSLFGLAGLFFALGSPFVGAMQVLIYIGGISVLLVFAVMLSTSMAAPRSARNPLKTAASLLGAGLFFAAGAMALDKADFGEAAAAGAEAFGVERIGRRMLGEYDLVFEALSLLLVVAIMGAILIAHKERRQL